MEDVYEIVKWVVLGAAILLATTVLICVTVPAIIDAII